MIQIRTASIKEKLLIFLPVLFYLSEAINKFTTFTNGDSFFLAKTIKGIVLLYCGLCILFSKEYRHKLLPIIALILFFILGQLFIDPNFNQKIIINFIKYLFPLILFIYFNQNSPKAKTVNYTVELFEKIVLINSILIILGFVFNIYIFQTYEGKRFGFDGLLVSSSTATYFYSIALFHYFIKFKKGLFFSLQRGIILISILLVGTKSLIIVLLFILGLYTSLYIDKRWRKSIFLFIFLSFCYLSYYVIYKHEIFNMILQDDGILASITSLRSKILIEEMVPFIEKNWQWPNYLFGGINNILTRPQMSILDLFYFFGVIGSFIYLYIYLKNYFSFKINNTHRLFFIVLFLVCLISGNFFINATTTIYMLIFRESIKNHSI